MSREARQAKRQRRHANNLELTARKAAELTSEKREPHEILRDAANGLPFKQRKLIIYYHKSGPEAGKESRREWIEEDYYPDYKDQIDAAKAAAPYFAPKLVSQSIGATEDSMEAFARILGALSDRLPS